MMKIPFSPPDITQEEIEQVIETLKSGWITTGPKTKEFERQIAEYVHTEKAVCLNSATACMELTLLLLGIGPGDEVITSAYTYTASASVVYHVGAKLVLVDTAPDSYFMDNEKLEQAITEKTKAIIPVDIAGVMCDYDELLKIVEGKRDCFKPNRLNEIQKALGRIAIIADAAHSFGAQSNGKMSGAVADFTSFSFHAVKNLTTAEGGAVVWRDIPEIENEWIYNQYQLLSLHGQSKDALAKTKMGAWEYDIVMPGYKCNMTDIMAGIGLVQFKRYETLLERRKEIVDTYGKAFSTLPVQILQHDGVSFHSSRHLYMVRLKGKSLDFRNCLIAKMAEEGIACNVHYKPLPMHTAYINMGFNINNFPNAYHQYKNQITLPLHTCLTDNGVDYVTKVFIKCVLYGID